MADLAIEQLPGPDRLVRNLVGHPQLGEILDPADLLGLHRIHVATMPPSVLRQMYNHPLTDKGLAAFLADWAKTGQKIL